MTKHTQPTPPTPPPPTPGADLTARADEIRARLDEMIRAHEARDREIGDTAEQLARMASNPRADVDAHIALSARLEGLKRFQVASAASIHRERDDLARIDAERIRLQGIRAELMRGRISAVKREQARRDALRDAEHRVGVAREYLEQAGADIARIDAELAKLSDV